MNKPMRSPDTSAEEGPQPSREHKPGKAGKNGAAKAASTRPIAGAARIRPRHRGLLLAFAGLVLLPTIVAAWYLWAWAEDQYASSLGFTVRREEVTSAMDLLGGLSNLSGASSTDTDILYEFIQSQELVRSVNEQLDLRTIYSRPAGWDPLFALAPNATIEDLLAHWRRMVRISYDPGTGLIELDVLAFTPRDAQRIAEVIFSESSEMINELSAIAREDAMRYAREDLEQAVERLREAREAMTMFRSRTQIVDPQADIQSQMGVLNTLQQQLAASLVELDLLSETASSSDPRVTQTERRIEVIRERIAEERRKFGIGGEGPGGEDYASLMAEYESLAVDREFAEQSYTAALTALDAARAEAQRQSRYLAAFVRPTLAEVAEYPRRWMLLGVVTTFAFLTWAILGLVYYSLRDRR